MGRPRQVSNEQILSAMRQAVLAHGPNVPLDQVAFELDVSAPALLKRFGSRQALMVAALRPPENPAWISYLDQGPSDAPLEEQLLDIFTRISEFMMEVLPCIISLRESGIPAHDLWAKPSGPERALKAMQRWVKAAHKRGLVTVPETDTAAYAMLGSVQTRAFMTHLMQRDFSKAAQQNYVVELARLFTRSLAP